MEKEFDEAFCFKCINNDCDGMGNIPVRDSDGDWTAEQCQYCFEKRFPAKQFLLSSIKEVLTEQIREVRGRMKTDVVEMVGYPGNSPIEAMVVINSTLTNIITYLEEGLSQLK